MLKKPIFNTLVQVAAKGVMILLSLVTTAILTRKLGGKNLRKLYVDHLGFFVV